MFPYVNSWDCVDKLVYCTHTRVHWCIHTCVQWFRTCEITCLNWFNSRGTIREFTIFCGQIGCTDTIHFGSEHVESHVSAGSVHVLLNVNS